MKNIKKIESESIYNIFKKTSSYVTPSVILLEDNYDIKYNKYIPPHNYSLDYFTIEAIENIDDLRLYYKNVNDSMSYSIDNGNTWNTMSEAVSLSAGNKIMFKGVPSESAGLYEQLIFINGDNKNKENTINGKFNVSGNIMSLIYGGDFIGKISFPSDFSYEFQYLFMNQSNLINANNLILPATTLANGCYAAMFYGCTSLITVPELPATTLVNNCYNTMFAMCTSLVTAPELPATTLSDSCYAAMFAICTSLVAAPELPATILADSCYSQMFLNCTALTAAPELLATTLSNGCYGNMFAGCTALTAAPELPATILGINCYNGMFASCSSLTTAPELPATTLSDSCYAAMFADCTSLVTAPELPATILSENCYEGMFAGCTTLTTAPELHATTLADSCYSQMFLNCTALTAAPELPATTLVEGCYNGMFQGCTLLNYIKCLATDISVSDCLVDWVTGVASSGTFVKNSSMNSWPTGDNGIPSGWTVQDA